MKSFFLTRAFTILELLIAILVSFLVIGGFSFFVIELNDQIQSTDNVAQVYTSLTDFVQHMNSVSRDYVIATSIDSATSSGSFALVMLSNTGGTSGILVGVARSEEGKWLVDTPDNYYHYDKRNLFIQPLSQSQVANIRADHARAYSIAIYADSIFSGLYPYKLSYREYNSASPAGAILDFSLVLYREFDGSAVGSDIRDLAFQKTTDLISVNLVF